MGAVNISEFVDGCMRLKVQCRPRARAGRKWWEDAEEEEEKGKEEDDEEGK